MKNIIKFIVDLFMKIYYFFNKKQYNKIKILSTIKTIELIRSKRLSVSRFGDGELLWILGKNKNSFQSNNSLLKSKLINVLTSDDKNTLICLPRVWIDMKDNNYSSARYWRLFLYRNFKSFKKYISNNKTYGNASFTRTYMPLKDKSVSKFYFEEIKKIWLNKKVTIIEGKNTRLGVNNDLFDNASSLERIICPATNAFDSYEKILREAKNVSKDNLVLIALGPTATILSYDLAKLGYQAIDIGHIDIEYEWFLKKAKKKISISGKDVNEASNKNEEKKIIYNDIYEKSIIKRIEWGDMNEQK